LQYSIEYFAANVFLANYEDRKSRKKNATDEGNGLSAMELVFTDAEREFIK
jgi:hypothetical protein